MKKCTIFILIVIVASCFGNIAAQDNDKILNRPYADMRRLHYGFSVGFHNQNLNLTHNGFVTESGEAWFGEVAELSPGFCVNIMADLRLAEHFNLRLSPGMYFGSKTVTFREAQSGKLEKQKKTRKGKREKQKRPK